MIIDGDIASDL